MSNSLRRMQRRKAMAKIPAPLLARQLAETQIQMAQDRSTINQRMENAEDKVVAALISISIDLAHEEGKTYEELCDLASKIVDKYESIKDFDKYAEDVLERTGVGIIKTK